MSLRLAVPGDEPVSGSKVEPTPLSANSKLDACYQISRPFNPALFTRDAVGPLLTSRTTSERGLVLGVDESLNDNRYIEPMTRRLVQKGLASMVTPLWYQTRVLSDGSRVSATNPTVQQRCSACCCPAGYRER